MSPSLSISKMQVNRLLIALFAVGFTFLATAQEPLHYKFRVYLKDKGTTNYSVNEPEKFLSEKSIERKKRQNVKIDNSDFPISDNYFSLLEKTGGKIVSHSKWFKTIVVQVSDSAKIMQIAKLPFVDSVRYVWRGTSHYVANPVRPRLEKTDCEETFLFKDYLGITQLQFKLHNATDMAKAGFQGKGIHVGVIDAGFTNYDVIPFFEKINLRGFENFVPTGEVFSSNDHGTKVFSTMAVNQPNLFMGSAPQSDYWLLRSEDAASEFPVEEDYWVRAIEFADSVGIDVVNTSLGYNDFDDISLNYTHADLTGKKSIMSLAADKAFEKGMIVVVSAGNEGNKDWKKTTPPGDAFNVLTVGAVGVDSLIAGFSSHGPAADGRVKPDVVSVGRATMTIGQNGLIGMANGTSFASPFMAGLVASLWSINPDMPRSQIIDIVKKSADRYNTPDSIYGHGIPDFGKAVAEVLKTLKPVDKKITEKSWSIESTPSGNAYNISLTEPEYTLDAYSVALLSENGKILQEYQFDKNNSVQFPLSSKTKKENKFLHFVINEPFLQKTFRIKL